MIKNNFKKIAFMGFLLLSITVFGQNAKKCYKSGQRFVKDKNYSDAIAQFTRAIEINPEYYKAYLERASVYEGIDKIFEAAADYNKACTFLEKKPDVFYNTGRLYYELGKYNEALKKVNIALGLDSRNIPALQVKIKSLIALKDYENALEDCIVAVKLDPKNSISFFYRGVVYEKLEFLDKAEKDFSKAVTHNRKYIEAYIAVARVRLKLNKLDNAITNCNSAIKLDPNNVEAYLTRASIYRKKLDYPSAINDLSKAIVLKPDDEELYLTRGAYYQDFKQHQNAINDFSKVIALNDKNSEAYYKRAFSYEEISNYPAAIKDYEAIASLSENNFEAQKLDFEAQKLLKETKARLFELNREGNKPEISLLDPEPKDDFVVGIAGNKTEIIIRGEISDESEVKYLEINGKKIELDIENKFLTAVDITGVKKITFIARDVYENEQTISYTIQITEINRPEILLIAPYASDNGEIYLSSNSPNLYIEGKINDESLIKSILIKDVSPSYKHDELNPTFFTTIDILNKDKFTIKVIDIFDNETEKVFKFNRTRAVIAEDNPMGVTWVIFIENSNYETFASLDGPVMDVSMMKAALANYEIHRIIHKEDMTKYELEKFFSIELRDLVRSNGVNSLLVWYAGHGKFIRGVGYWIPVDAERDDEFTYYNINLLKASMQSYSEYVTHTLVITDACESGPTFYQAMRSIPKERSCNDYLATKFKSSQVFSSAGYELAVDNSQFTRTFANTLTNNPNYCIPIESIVLKVTKAVIQNNQQKPKFGKIIGLEDEDGTFFFILKNK